MRKILLLLLLIASFAATAQTKWPFSYDLTSFKGTVSIGKPAWPSFAVGTVYLEIGDNSGPGYYNFAKTGKATFKYYTNDVGETYYLTTDANGELKMALVEWAKISGVPANLTTGSGTAGYVTRWTAANTLGNSLIQDNGTTVTAGGVFVAGTGRSTLVAYQNDAVTIGSTAAGSTMRMLAGAGTGSFMYLYGGGELVGQIGVSDATEITIEAYSGNRLNFNLGGAAAGRMHSNGNFTWGTTTDMAVKFYNNGTFYNNGAATVAGNVLFSANGTYTSGQTSVYKDAQYGLSINGTGTSYDVTASNKTGQIAWRVPTGTQNVQMMGSLDVGTNISTGALTIWSYTGAAAEFAKHGGWTTTNIYAGGTATPRISITATNTTIGAGQTTVNLGAPRFQYGGVDILSEQTSRVLNFGDWNTTTAYFDKLDLYTRNGGAGAVVSRFRQTKDGVRIGSNTDPTAYLHLSAGTATAGTAPLKFTAGTSLTTPENGSVEFDGTNYYATAGGVRKTILTSATATAVESGTYTPTLTGVSNVTSISGATSCQYMRVGNVVTVSGNIQLEHTTNGASTTVSISLPIASAFSGDNELSGAGAGFNVSVPIAIRAEAVNDVALLVFAPGSSSGTPNNYSFTFTYRII
jgi:hypothetical protein